MVTVVVVNIKRKTEMKVSSQREFYGMKGNLVSCMCSLDCAGCVLALVFFCKVGGIKLDAMCGESKLW